MIDRNLKSHCYVQLVEYLFYSKRVQYYYFHNNKTQVGFPRLLFLEFKNLVQHGGGQNPYSVALWPIQDLLQRNENTSAWVWLQG